MPGSAANVDPGNDHRLSNASGDTLLLTDDPNAEVDTRPELPVIVLIIAALQTKAALKLDETTVSRISSDRILSVIILRRTGLVLRILLLAIVAAVFDALARQDFPPQSIRCLQRRPSGEMIITFATSALQDALVRNNAFRIQNQSFVINDEDRPITFLNIYDAPYELPYPVLEARLAPYCKVLMTRQGRFHQSNVFKGMRHYRVRIRKPIPSYLQFEKFLVSLSHDGQQHTCHRCNRLGHFANECTNTVCFNCDGLGHQSCEPRRHPLLYLQSDDSRGAVLPPFMV